MRRLDRRWAGCAAAVLGGWLAGAVFWGVDGGDGRPAPLDWGEPLALVTVGAPVAAVAGTLIAGPRIARVTGNVMLVAVTVGLAYLVSFAFFPGFCLDPDDVCGVTWPSRILVLLAGLASIAAGWAAHRWAASRRGRLRNAGA